MEAVDEFRDRRRCLLQIHLPGFGLAIAGLGPRGGTAAVIAARKPAASRLARLIEVVVMA